METVESLIKKYEAYAQSQGFLVNPDRQRVENIVKALLKKEELQGDKYCPCRVVTGDKQEDKKIVCPCVYHKDEIEQMGHCLCWLFVKR